MSIASQYIRGKGIKVKPIIVAVHTPFNLTPQVNISVAKAQYVLAINAAVSSPQVTKS